LAFLRRLDTWPPSQIIFFLSEGSTRHAYNLLKIVHESRRPRVLFPPPLLRGPRSLEASFYVWRVDGGNPKIWYFSFDFDFTSREFLSGHKSRLRLVDATSRMLGPR
jgi:hypothetical protein